jgi:hypothetical protein
MAANGTRIYKLFAWLQRSFGGKNVCLIQSIINFVNLDQKIIKYIAGLSRLYQKSLLSFKLAANTKSFKSPDKQLMACEMVQRKYSAGFIKYVRFTQISSEEQQYRLQVPRQTFVRTKQPPEATHSAR